MISPSDVQKSQKKKRTTYNSSVMISGIYIKITISSNSMSFSMMKSLSTEWWLRVLVDKYEAGLKASRLWKDAPYHFQHTPLFVREAYTQTKRAMSKVYKNNKI